MNIVLNFLPLKSGGGLQVGLDFLRQLDSVATGHRWFLVASEGTPFADVAVGARLERLPLIPRSLHRRLAFEYYGAAHLVRRVAADVVYTQFGPHWPAARCIHVVGCAYSNLFYPEVDFWGGLPALERARRRVIDRARLTRLRSATHVIFETPEIARRAIALRGFAPHRVSHVLPSPSSLVLNGPPHPSTARIYAGLPRAFRVLLLSGYHPNKNVELLPKVAKELREHGRDDFVFLTTLPPAHPGTGSVLREARALRVERYVLNIGPIDPRGLSELYRAVDAVILPSRLESFSNTIAEAWCTHRPLMIGDHDWSRALCADAAAYFPHDDPAAAAKVLMRLIDEEPWRRQLVARGQQRLTHFPSPRQRFLEYVKIIERAAAENA